ncbi:MAG: hypothetical protein AAGU11_21850, partial [Syntrophobacteraceae bacterium]
MSLSLKPVLVFIADGSPPESLIALHALLSLREKSALVVYRGDFSALLSRYLAIPFINAPWPGNPPVHRDLSRVRGLLDTGEIAGILVQASNSFDSASREDLYAILEMASRIPIAYLDMADDPGKHALLSRANYLKGSIFREFPLDASVEPAPYLHWGLGNTGWLSGDDHPRPVDVCFLGSGNTHRSRERILSLFEEWSRKHAGMVRTALYLSELSDLDRPSQAQYLEILRQSKICLDLWGHAAQTRRLYEGMWAGCLVLSQAPRWRPTPWTPGEGEHFTAF